MSEPEMIANIENDVRGIIAEILEVDPQTLTPDLSLQTRGQIRSLDSVAMLEMLVTIERKYQIDISEEEINQINTLEQVAALIRKKITTNPSTAGA